MGWDEKKLEEIEVAAPLHDVDKVGILDAILNKPGTLSSQELEVMKTHPLLGRDIVSDIGFLKSAVPYMLYHQKGYDGSGVSPA